MCNGKAGNRYERKLHEQGIHEEEIDYRVMECYPQTVVIVEYDGIHGAGHSTKSKVDKPNRVRGRNIAYGRAMQSLWEQVGEDESVKKKSKSCGCKTMEVE